MWIDAASVPWLIAYLADEVNTGGVAVEPAVAGTSPAPNCATPGLAIHMKPQEGAMDTYEARFVEGPLKDTSMISNISTFTQAKWDKCQATAARWQCPGPLLADAQPDDVARAVAHFLELACARMLLGHLGHGASDVDDPIAAVAGLGHESASP